MNGFFSYKIWSEQLWKTSIVNHIKLCVYFHQDYLSDLIILIEINFS